MTKHSLCVLSEGHLEVDGAGHVAAGGFQVGHGQEEAQIEHGQTLPSKFI